MKRIRQYTVFYLPLACGSNLVKLCLTKKISSAGFAVPLTCNDVTYSLKRFSDSSFTFCNSPPIGNLAGQLQWRSSLTHIHPLNQMYIFIISKCIPLSPPQNRQKVLVVSMYAVYTNTCIIYYSCWLYRFRWNKEALEL